MEKDLETDAVGVETPSSTNKSDPAPPKPGPHSSVIHYEAPGGGRFSIWSAGNNPQMQIGNNNTMYILDKGRSRKSRSSAKVIKPNRLPIVQSHEVPNGTAIDIVADNIGKDWKCLGRRLGLHEGELDNLKLDFHQEGQYEVSYQMLRKWKEQAYPTELGQLARTCADIGRGDIADLLADLKMSQK